MWGAARLIAGPSTTGSRFVLLEARYAISLVNGMFSPMAIAKAGVAHLVCPVPEDEDAVVLRDQRVADAASPTAAGVCRLCRRPHTNAPSRYVFVLYLPRHGPRGDAMSGL